MEIKSSVPAGNLSQQDKFLKSLRSFSTIVRRTTISTTTIVRKTLTKLPAAFLGNFSPVDGGGGEGVGVGKKEEKEKYSCYASPTPPMRPPKPHPGQKVKGENIKQEEKKCQLCTNNFDEIKHFSTRCAKPHWVCGDVLFVHITTTTTTTKLTSRPKEGNLAS